MVQVKDRIELKLQDLWRKVKSEEAWWGNMKEETLRFVKRLLESALEEELLEVTACWSLLYSSRSILRHHFQPLFAVIARYEVPKQSRGGGDTLRLRAPTCRGA